MNEQKTLREHLIELLDGGSAHIRVQDAIADFSLERINDRPGDSAHSAWELLEHIRIAQWDILDFSINPEYEEMSWPDDYWPKQKGSEANWRKSVEQVLSDLRAMIELVSDEKIDLFAKIPHGTGQTVLREVMLVADHNAYHLGQLVLLKKMFDIRH
jgi:uncharacterized damage-inducible protein DinB